MLSCTFSMFWTTVTSQTSSEKRRTNRHTVKPTVMFGSRAGFAKGSHTLPCFHKPQKALCHRPHHGSCRKRSLRPFCRSQQGLVESEAPLRPTPYMSLLSWEYMPCKLSLSKTWPQGMMRRRRVLVVSSTLVQGMCAPWRATSSIRFRAYTVTDSISVSNRGPMRVGRLSVR